MAVMRAKPKMVLRAGTVILPIVLLAYLIEASSHAFYWPLFLYIGVLFLAGGFDLWNFAALLTVHISYTIGLLVGIFRKDVSWT